MMSSLTLLYPDGYRPRPVPSVGDFDIARYDELYGGQLPLSNSMSTGSSVLVSGWTFDALRGLPAAGVLLVFGTNVVEAAYGEARADVAQHYGDPRLTRTGFRGIVTPSAAPPGPQHLSVHAISSDGAEIIELAGGREFQVVAGDVPIGFGGTRRPGLFSSVIDAFSTTGRKLDLAHPAVERGCHLTVEGWAIDAGRTQPVAGVFAVLDERDVVRGYVGGARPDVCAAMGSDDVLACGFQIHVSTGSLSPGTHRLQLGAVGADGSDYDIIDVPARIYVTSALRR